MNVDKNFQMKKVDSNGINWINAMSTDKIKTYGFYWFDNKSYNRLPNNAEKLLKNICPNVVSLGKNTSGGQLHFRTNSSKLMISATVDSTSNISGMTPIARAGFDCYVGPSFKELLFYNATTFDASNMTYTSTLFNGNQKDVIVVINFPLYVGVKELYIGIQEDAFIEPYYSYDENDRIVVYGTSITQGGCASRPGLSYTNRLSRSMRREFLNFGFSGNAFGEIELINILTDIAPASMFIIDYEANSGTNGKLEKTLEDIIKNIRNKNADIKIMVVSRIPYLFEDLNMELGLRRKNIRDFQSNLVKRLQDDGDNNIVFVDGSKFLGENYHEFTVDTIHPNDLGFQKIVDSLEPHIKKTLNN